MRDVIETRTDRDDPVDRLLQDAGGRWRDGQPEPRAIGPALFADDRAPRFDVAQNALGRAFLAGAASAVVALVFVALVAPTLLPRLPGGGPVATADPETGYIPTGQANCPLTRPDGSFTPPPQAGVDWDVDAGLAWYGSPELWTLLDRDGEVWTGLPRSELGLGQKTFWWRRGYEVRLEPRPEIFVTGDRLDGPGSFTFGLGTNASWGLGSAMLVGVEVPEGGCWELTGRYYDEQLSYVVWVEDAG